MLREAWSEHGSGFSCLQRLLQKLEMGRSASGVSSLTCGFVTAPPPSLPKWGFMQQPLKGSETPISAVGVGNWHGLSPPGRRPSSAPEAAPRPLGSEFTSAPRRLDA